MGSRGIVCCSGGFNWLREGGGAITPHSGSCGGLGEGGRGVVCCLSGSSRLWVGDKGIICYLRGVIGLSGGFLSWLWVGGHSSKPGGQ